MSIDRPHFRSDPGMALHLAGTDLLIVAKALDDYLTKERDSVRRQNAERIRNQVISHGNLSLHIIRKFDPAHDETALLDEKS